MRPASRRPLSGALAALLAVSTASAQVATARVVIP